MFKATLFIITPNWKLPRYQSTDNCHNIQTNKEKLSYIYTREYYLAIKGTYLTHATT